jgi:hypothetical protein
VPQTFVRQTFVKLQNSPSIPREVDSAAFRREKLDQLHAGPMRAAILGDPLKKTIWRFFEIKKRMGTRNPRKNGNWVTALVCFWGFLGLWIITSFIKRNRGVLMSPWDT